MDDATNKEYSRAPEQEDVLLICQSLNEVGAKYILIGGFGVILQGGARFTKDVDLLVDPSVENIRKVKQALARLPDNAIALIEDNDLQKYGVVRVADEVVVDLLAKACGVSYEEAVQGIDYKEWGGVRIPVAKKEFLIRMKDTFRPLDQADILFLKDEIQRELAPSLPSPWQKFWKKLCNFFGA